MNRREPPTSDKLGFPQPFTGRRLSWTSLSVFSNFRGSYLAILRRPNKPARLSKGSWKLTLATPLRGRAIPFHFLTYSSRTFEDHPSSRNLEHLKAVQEIQQLIGTQQIVFDREFSYRELLNSLVDEGIHFVIRLNIVANPPIFYYDAERKQRLQLLVAPINEPQIYRQVYYMGEVCLNVVGIWRYGFSQPMWIITNMEPEAGLALYFQRMKIEICFRDLKSLLHIHKVMNKSQSYLNKMLAMVMLAYAISLILGEAIRDVQYAQGTPHELNLLTVPSVDKRFVGFYIRVLSSYSRSVTVWIKGCFARLSRQPF